MLMHGVWLYYHTITIYLNTVVAYTILAYILFQSKLILITCWLMDFSFIAVTGLRFRYISNVSNLSLIRIRLSEL